MKKCLLSLILIASVMLTAFGLVGCNVLTEEKYRDMGYVYVEYDLCKGVMSNVPDTGTKRLYYEPPFYVPEPGDEKYTTLKAPVLNDHSIYGWYTGYRDEDGEVVYEKKWDFKTDKVEKDTILYARWRKNARVNVYDVSHIDKEGNHPLVFTTTFPKETTLPTDIKKSGFTFLEKCYSDEACTQQVTKLEATVFDKPDETETFNLYSEWLTGEYILVKTPEDIGTAAVERNYYLLNDIDFSKNVWRVRNDYTGEIAGNGYTISNITVVTDSNSDANFFGLFQKLCSGTVIKDVTFDNIDIIAAPVPTSKVSQVRFGALAGLSEDNVTISNVKFTNTVLSLYVRAGVTENISFASDGITDKLIANKSSTTEIKNCDYSNIVANRYDYAYVPPEKG